MRPEAAYSVVHYTADQLPTSLHLFRSLDYGGSQIRPEATGFGTVIFALAVLKDEVSGPAVITYLHTGVAEGPAALLLHSSS